MSFASNLRLAATHPDVARDCLAYAASYLFNAGRPTRTLCGVRVRNFARFSEFYWSTAFVSAAERAFLESDAIGPGDLIDVGANLGVVTGIIARRFPDRTVHSFEPNPTTYAALVDNCTLNGFSNVETQPLVVSDAVGEVQFGADPVDRGRASIRAGAGSCRLLSTTLDAYAAAHGIGRIGLLKVDVEGYETLVFRGAQRLLSTRAVAVIYYEICPALARSAGFAAEEASQCLLDHGYSLFRIDAGGTLVATSVADVGTLPLDNWVAVAR